MVDCNELSYPSFKNILYNEQSLMNIKPCLKNCKNIGNTYICNNYIVKVNIYGIIPEEILIKEYNNYMFISKNNNLLKFIYEIPYLYKDKDGYALVFHNYSYIRSLDDIYFKDYSHIDDINQLTPFLNLIKKAKDMLIELNEMKYYHNDSHLGNIIYNYNDDKVYLIDLDSFGTNNFSGVDSNYEELVYVYEKILSDKIDINKKKSLIKQYTL